MPTQMMSGIAMGTGGSGLEVEFVPSPFIVAKQFDTFSANVKSFKEPLGRAVRQVMVPSIRKGFDTGGYGEWTPLAELTVRNRRQEGYGPEPILIRSGTLRRVATQLNIWSINGPEGTAVIEDLPDRAWYGKVHQAGLGEDALDEGSIVARPWAVIQTADMAEIEEIFLDWIDERMGRDLGA